MNKNLRDYLDKINSGYLEYIKSQTELNVLIETSLIKISWKSRRLSLYSGRNQEENFLVTYLLMWNVLSFLGGVV
jgi:hypothetical protein